MAIRTILGTMGVGGPIDLTKTNQILHLFKQRGHRIDTALMYQGGNTEKILGQANKEGLVIATKANPWFDGERGVTTTETCRGLKPETLRKQVGLSLESLRMKKADLFYLHAPDHETPLLDTLKTIHEMKEQDLFSEWGLSNYSSWEVVHIYHICKANGWQPPSVYQGMYNCLTRVVEKELFPALRVCNMRFYAYNPLAGGILSGRYKRNDDPDSGRFSNKTTWGNRYRERFWNNEYFEAIEMIEKACAPHSIPLMVAATSWMYHHSLLSEKMGDGVIIGGSSVEQITENLDVVDKLQKLPQDVLQVMEEAWKITQPVCQQYFR